jgi:hypothetical protein
MFASIFMLITTPDTAVAAPNLPIVLAESRNIIALINGIAVVPITIAAAGLGLNVKCWPFESGSTKKKMYHMDENQRAANAGISAILASF